METISILIAMNLAGQAENASPARRCTNQHGYAMAALIVAMGVMALMMTVVMPVWKQTAQREKEEELVFRGKQYVHAIGLYQRKFANAYPPNIDLLVDQKFLRKKYKDPITHEDFVVLPPGQALPGAPAAPGQRGGAAGGTGGGIGARGGIGAGAGAGIGPGSGAGTGGGIGPGGGTGRGATTTAPQPSTSQPGSRGGLAPIGSQPGGIGGGTVAGVAGVTSKSKDQSLRLYNGRNHYNEWAFVYTPQLQPGQVSPGAPGAINGPQRGQPSVGPGRSTDPTGRGIPTQGGPGRFGPGGGGQSPFGPNNPNNPPGGRGFGPGQPIQPILPPRGR
jgi:type II secretory pathway pseudopilin PulG